MSAGFRYEWEDAAHRLKFIFGEYCFYSAWFDAVELTTPVARLAGSLDELAARVPALLGRHGAVAVPAHPIANEPARLKITRDYLRYVPAATSYYFVEPDHSFDKYLARMPRRHRHELLRKTRRFIRHSGGDIDLRSYRTVAEAREFYSLARALSRKTYQRRLLDVGLPETAAFEAELLGRAQCDAMRGYLLFDRDTPIAYALCTAAADCLRFRFIGYDPAFRELSAGMVLICEALRRAIGEGRFAAFDFGSGEAQYKRVFATGMSRCATVFFFRPTARCLFRVVAHRACISASDACTALARRLGIKERLKQRFRTPRSAMRG